MKRIYDKLRLCQLDPEQSKARLDYWFTVTHGSMSHTAFRTQEALMLWLEERGLKLTEELAEHGEWKPQKIEGRYVSHMHHNYTEFYGLKDDAEEVRKLSNGSYTLGLITTDAEGIKTVNYLAPASFRHTFDYRKTYEMRNRGIGKAQYGGISR